MAPPPGWPWISVTPQADGPACRTGQFEYLRLAWNSQGPLIRGCSPDAWPPMTSKCCPPAPSMVTNGLPSQLSLQPASPPSPADSHCNPQTPPRGGRGRQAPRPRCIPLGQFQSITDGVRTVTGKPGEKWETVHTTTAQALLSQCPRVTFSLGASVPSVFLPSFSE